MTIQTGIWIPPSLCGCQLQITADWTDGSVVDGVSYRHPIPFTIKDIQLVQVCPDHITAKDSMPGITRHYEIDKFTGEQVQRRGYLQHPIANPTEAQCLYEYLCSFNGMTHSYPCGCSSHVCDDGNGNLTYLEHPKHTKKCKDHKQDSLDMQQAKLAHDTIVAQAEAALSDKPIN